MIPGVPGMKGIPPLALNTASSARSDAIGGSADSGAWVGTGDFSVQFGGIGGAGSSKLLPWLLAGAGVLWFLRKKAA